MIRTITLRPYFGAAALASTATLLRAANAPHSKFLYEQLVTPDLFEPATLVFSIFLGLLMIATTPRPTLIRLFVERISDKAFTSFSAVAGAIAGWGLAECVLHVITHGSSGVTLAFAVGGYAVFLTLVPMWAFETLVPVVRDYTSLRFRERRGLAVIQLFGWLLTFYGFWNLWQWAVHD